MRFSRIISRIKFIAILLWKNTCQQVFRPCTTTVTYTRVMVETRRSNLRQQLEIKTYAQQLRFTALFNS